MTTPQPPCQRSTLTRREVLVGAGVAGGALLVGYPLLRMLRPMRASTFIARNQRYDGPLSQTIADGFEAVGFDIPWVRGRKVLLKPNMVEPTRASPQMTTHPAVVVATAEVFRRWGAEVTVAEAPGHVRDTEMALYESGIGEALGSERIAFADINYSATRYVKNAGGLCGLDGFHLPVEVADADLVVSMPKLKTHHWMGITAAMKNLYGTLPGLVYGWPKNVLHYAGIPQTVVDINASLPRTIAVVDGILCMEGDGPILGTPKPMGLLAVGLNPAALDATLARIIGLEPAKVPYLALADGRLGPVAERSITERGERWREVASPFALVDAPHLNALRAS